MTDYDEYARAGALLNARIGRLAAFIDSAAERLPEAMIEELLDRVAAIHSKVAALPDGGPHPLAPRGVWDAWLEECTAILDGVAELEQFVFMFSKTAPGAA